MRAIAINPSRPGRISFVPDHPDPVPAAGEVLVRVDLAGICATDLEILRGYLRFSGIPGHEFVGTVVRGSDVLCGRRVVAEINCVEPGSPARDPDARKHAAPRTVLGISGRPGVFAEYVAVPAENCHVVPSELSDREAVFAEPLAAACQVVRDHPVRPETRAAVLGTGRLGILCGQVLAAAGTRPTMIGRNRRTLEVCRRLGLPTCPVPELSPQRRYDLVVECTGAPAGLPLALKLVRPRGKVILKSTCAQAAELNLSPAVVDEITIAGNRCGPFPEALRLLRERKVRVPELIDAVFPLARGAEAFEAAGRPGALKVLLEPGAG